MSEPDWEQVIVVAPAAVVQSVLELLQTQHGFRDIAPIDWCVLERRQDYARGDWAPCGPLTTNRYVGDWRDAPPPG